MPSLPILVLNSGSSSIKFSLYEAGNGERTRLLEGAVDGIGTDLGKFWIKDAADKKLVDQTPAVPSRAVAFKLVADALNSDEFQRRRPSDTAWFAEDPQFARTSASRLL
jgi:acetate kinase